MLQYFALRSAVVSNATINREVSFVRLLLIGLIQTLS